MVSVVSCVLYKECLQSQFDSFKKSRGCGTVHHELRTGHVFETNDPKICGTIVSTKSTCKEWPLCLQFTFVTSIINR